MTSRPLGGRWPPGPYRMACSAGMESPRPPPYCGCLPARRAAGHRRSTEQQFI